MKSYAPYLKQQVIHWNNIADTQNDNESTHPDTFLALLEIEFMLKNIKGKVLNIGCGTGSETNYCSRITGFPAIGIDLSDKMITKAKDRFPQLEFKVANILEIPYPSSTFDSITTRRTLINILNHNDQIKAIEEMKRVLKPEGHLIIIEASVEGYHRLNIMRKQMGLEEIKVVDYNLPINEDDITSILPDSTITYLDNYYYLTRIYYPLVVEDIQYNTQFQEKAYLLQNAIESTAKCSPHILIKWIKPNNNNEFS